MTEKAPDPSKQWQPKRPLPESIRDRELMVRALRRAAEVAARRRAAWADKPEPGRP